MFKGALGRILLEHGTIEGVRLEPETANPQLYQNGSGQGVSRAFPLLIDEYQKDPQKFHRYAQVFDTWLNAMKIADAAVRVETGTQAVSSSSVQGVIPQEKLDAWGHAYCVIRNANRIVIISGGPDVSEPISCHQIKMSPADILVTTPSSVEQRPDGSLVLTFSLQGLDKHPRSINSGGKR
jgi:hypothetical protein